MYTFNRGQETNYCYLSNVESIRYTCHLTAFLIYHCCGCGSYIFPLKARHALLFCLLQCGCVPRRIVSLVFYLGCNHDYVLITHGKDSQLLKVQEEKPGEKLFQNFLNFWEISTLLQNRLVEGNVPEEFGQRVSQKTDNNSHETWEGQDFHKRLNCHWALCTIFTILLTL